MLREEFMALNTYVRKESKIKDLSFCLRKLGKEEQIRPKVRTGKKLTIKQKSMRLGKVNL